MKQDIGPKAPAAGGARPAEETLSSRDLFGGRREVIIDHGGQRYRLRITGSNKLILIK